MNQNQLAGAAITAQGTVILHVAEFELNNRGGERFSRREHYVLAGLADIHMRERVEEEFADAFGSTKRYTATSTEAFVINVVSEHFSENADGTTQDLSKVMTFASEEKEVSHACASGQISAASEKWTRVY